MRHSRHSRRGLGTLISTVLLLVGATIMGSLAISWTTANRTTQEHILESKYNDITNKIKESLIVENTWLGETSPPYVNVTLKNTGEIGLNVTEIKLDRGNARNVTKFSNVGILPGDTFSTTIKYDWRSTNPTNVFVRTARDNVFQAQTQPPVLGALVINKLSQGDDGTFNFDGDLGPFTITTSGSSGGAPGSPQIHLEGTIRDFKGKNEPGGHPDFEDEIMSDLNMVKTTLGGNKKPDYNGSPATPTTTGDLYFQQWFNTIDGVNIEIPYTIVLADDVSQNCWNGVAPAGDGVFTYCDDTFFPIDSLGYGITPGFSYNYHFTYEIHTQFTYQLGQSFSFVGDDDVWVFIDKQRVIDLGGVHPAQSASVNLDTLGLTVGNIYDLDFFFAERHTVASDFRIDTTIELGVPGKGTSTSFYVSPSSYSVFEVVPNGWDLISITCDGPFSVNGNQVTISVVTGTTNTCTVTNRVEPP